MYKENIVVKVEPAEFVRVKEETEEFIMVKEEKVDLTESSEYKTLVLLDSEHQAYDMSKYPSDDRVDATHVKSCLMYQL